MVVGNAYGVPGASNAYFDFFHEEDLLFVLRFLISMCYHYGRLGGKAFLYPIQKVCYNCETFIC